MATSPRSMLERGDQCCCKGLQVGPLLLNLGFPFLLWHSHGSISPSLINMNGSSGEGPASVNTWMGPGQDVQGQDQAMEVAQP